MQSRNVCICLLSICTSVCVSVYIVQMLVEWESVLLEHICVYVYTCVQDKEIKSDKVVLTYIFMCVYIRMVTSSLA